MSTRRKRAVAWWVRYFIIAAGVATVSAIYHPIERYGWIQGGLVLLGAGFVILGVIDLGRASYRRYVNRDGAA